MAEPGSGRLLRRRSADGTVPLVEFIVSLFSRKMMDLVIPTRVLLQSLWRISYIAIATILAIAAYHEYLRLSSRVKGLPGPRGYPIIGNLWQIKGKPAYEVYRKWAQEFGPVFQGEQA